MQGTLNPARIKLLIETIHEWGSLVDAAEWLALKLLGTLALIYLVIRAILK